MRIILAMFIGAVFALGASGCVPYRYTDCPAGTGVVVDGASGSPLAGAQVSLFSSTGPAMDERLAPVVSTARFKIITDSQGHFSWAPEQSWGLVFVGEDFAFSWWRLEVRRKGYDPAQIEFGSESITRDAAPFRIELWPAFDNTAPAK